MSALGPGVTVEIKAAAIESASQATIATADSTQKFQGLVSSGGGHGISATLRGVPMGAAAWPLLTAARSSALGYCCSSQ